MAAKVPAITTGGIYPGVSNGAIMNILVVNSTLSACTFKTKINMEEFRGREQQFCD